MSHLALLPGIRSTLMTFRYQPRPSSITLHDHKRKRGTGAPLSHLCFIWLYSHPVAFLSAHRHRECYQAAGVIKEQVHKGSRSSYRCILLWFNVLGGPNVEMNLRNVCFWYHFILSCHL